MTDRKKDRPAKRRRAKKDRPAKRRSLTSATNPTRAAVEAAAALAISHPQQLQEAIRLTAALAQRHANADEVAAFAAIIVAAHVEHPDSDADWRKAARAATKRAAAAIARTTLGSTEAAIPLDPALFTDDTRAALSHEAPDAFTDADTKPADYTDAALALAPVTDAQRAALTEAVNRARAEGAPYRRTLTPRPAQRAALTCADDGSAWRDRVRRAVAACRTVEAAALADPFQDGTARPCRNRWTPDALALAALPPRTPVAKKDRPAQVPAWQTPGGTAHPDAGALVTVRNYDTGTPGVDLQHVTVTAPDGSVWLNRWTQHPLTRAEVAALSATLAAPTAATAADALTTVERRMVNPDQGKPVATPSRRPSRVGNTGPTVATFAAVGMTR